MMFRREEGSMDENKLILSNAYRIFFAEFDKHLTRARTAFTGLEQCTDDERKVLSTAFHTIKGGAGFFALDDVARTAGTLEKLFAESVSSASFDLQSARSNLQKLEQLYREMPEPSV